MFMVGMGYIPPCFQKKNTMATTAMGHGPTLPGTLWDSLWTRSSNHRQVLPRTMESQAAGLPWSWEHPVMARFLKPMKLSG